MRHHALAGSLLLLSLAACGDDTHPVEAVKQTVSDGVDAVKSKVDVLIDRANGAIDASPLRQREAHCAMEDGVMVGLLTISPCSEGTAILTLDGAEERQTCGSGTGGDYPDVCTHRDTAGRLYFNDGPSSPNILSALGERIGPTTDIGQWNELFWAAAVNHDYCYHHNGISYGYTQEDCDRQLYSDVSAVCAQQRYARDIPWFDAETCRSHAALAYAALRSQGGDCWDVMDTRVDYPAWTPLWEAFEMDGEVMDREIMELVEKYVAS